MIESIDRASVPVATTRIELLNQIFFAFSLIASF